MCLVCVFRAPDLGEIGAQAFWTTKCFWNDENRWRVSNFVWQGVDGSRIFTYEFQYNWTGFFDIKKYQRTGRLPTPEKAGTVPVLPQHQCGD